MQNPLLKNNKTWLFGDLQHRTSHYNRIICAKSAYISSESPKKQKLINHLNCKFFNNREAERKSANKRLVKCLIDIERKSSSFRTDQSRGSRLRKNQFQEKIENGKIMQENLHMFKKILNASSDIGSKKEWKSRKKHLENYKKILENKRLAYINLDQQFYTVYQKLKHHKNPTSVLKVESKLQESQKMGSLRLKKREKFYTQPIDMSEDES